MSVTVRVPSALRKLTNGESEVSARGGTVRELFDDLGKGHPDLLKRIMGDGDQVKQFLNVFVNGTDIRYEKALDTPVKDGDEVSIVPSIAGGVEPDGGAEQEL